jgi:hypothetical protein
MNFSEEVREDGIDIGNNYYKHGSKNPIANWIMYGFENNLATHVAKVAPTAICEIGRSEGHGLSN